MDGIRDHGGTGATASNPVVRRFIDGLYALEVSGDPSQIVEVFTEGCSVTNVILKRPMEGRKGAEVFWREYRQTFQTIQSTFKEIIEGEDAAALEWTSIGTLKTGKQVEYGGVSILVFEGDSVREFRTYFDSRDLHEEVK